MSIDVSPLGVGDCRQVDPERVRVPARLAIMTNAAVRDARSKSILGMVAHAHVHHEATKNRGGIMTAPSQGQLEALLQWLQSFHHWTDPATVDTLCDPLRTIKTQEGDCGTINTVLLSAVLALGYPAHLLQLQVPNAPEDHVVVEFWDGETWRLADGTAYSPMLDEVRVPRWNRGYQGPTVRL